jgi:hypothetical protein
VSVWFVKPRIGISGYASANLVRVDARDVGDHAVGRVDALDRDQVMAWQQALQLPPEEQVDPYQQDRGHAANVTPLGLVSNA